MDVLKDVAITAVAWIATIVLLVWLIITEKIPGEERHIAFYFMLQAAVPVFVFWSLVK
jgi:hypothetical protein